MIVLGLTGSIGMGKSTTLGLFAEMGALTWDADAAVHSLYAPGGAAVGPIEAAFPGVTASGGVDRVRLAEALQADPGGLARLEAIVHPLVRAQRQALRAEARAKGARLVVLDIPLLFETGGLADLDAVVVVTDPVEVQRARVLARPGMTEAKFAQLLARQMPDAEKRHRADFVIDTSLGLASAREAVRVIVDRVTAPGWTPPRPLPPGDEAGQ